MVTDTGSERKRRRSLRPNSLPRQVFSQSVKNSEVNLAGTASHLGDNSVDGKTRVSKSQNNGPATSQVEPVKHIASSEKPDETDKMEVDNSNVRIE